MESLIINTTPLIELLNSTGGIPLSITTTTKISWMQYIPSLLIGAFVLMSNRLGGLDLAFKAFGIFLLAILAAIGDAFYEAIMLPMRAIILLINAAIAGSNKFLKTDFNTIKQPEFAPMSKKVWEMREQLIAESDVRRQEKIDADAKRDLEKSNQNNVNINVEGDVTDANLMDKIKKGIEEQINDINNRFNGTTTGG